jgi:hypothetical protein
MKKGLKYKVISDVMYMDAKGGMAYRIQEVEFTKKKGMKKDDMSAEGGKKTGTNGGKKEPEVITHRARIVTYPDVKRRKGKGGKEIVKGKMVIYSQTKRLRLDNKPTLLHPANPLLVQVILVTAPVQGRNHS